MNEDDIYDILVVGGGVVGLSILRSATLKGWKCVLVEAEAELLSHASGSNSGIACTGVDASPGTLERALVRDSISRIREFCKDFNIPTRPCGSLVCQWSWDKNEDGERHSLQDVLLESHVAGDTNASMLTSEQVKNLEPNLSPECQEAVHIPGEIVVDPWLFSVCFATHARENGAKILTNWKFDPDASTFDDEVWTAIRDNNKEYAGETDSGPTFLRARAVVNATALWSDRIQKRALQGKLPTKTSSEWTANPRRGQYQIFSMNENTKIKHPIQPVPTQRTKGIFVFGTLYDQIAVGPTALDQTSKTDRSVDPNVARQLSLLAHKIVPELDPESSYVGSYVGIRPGTDKRDYRIHLTSELNWIAATGIRSTGLTASLGIGRHIVHLLGSILPEPEPSQNIKTTPLPPVLSLVKQFHQRGDGAVVVNGNVYRVTHPITKFGWEAMSGIADPRKYSTDGSKRQSRL